ncbi:MULTISPECIES: right-handed parallel beta-helix repeat-containing protein [unclassified Streptomyces]|uniref:right-handed parallel beta-helix repeat-containing protein n=1 Tax=unclassified Streptomyces TaxID=2593676 RepID=UPI00278C333F|nr:MULTISPECIES: right-handed parallel beta-helix repeat-containing protein [unclassified Streptomyces]
MKLVVTGETGPDQINVNGGQQARVIDVTAGLVSSVNGRTGGVTLDAEDVGADPAGAAAAAQTAAVTAATDTAAADATAKIAAHSTAADPHGDRAYSSAALLDHTDATDPHGDRAYADSLVTTGVTDWINVRRGPYNARGNGTTDDTAAIQAAITTAATTGSVVYIPAGTYRLTASLAAAADNVQIRGAGAAVTVLAQSSTTANGITGTDRIRFTLSDLTLSGPGTGTGTGLKLALAAGDAVPYVRLDNVTVATFGLDGIDIDTPIVSTFTGVIAVSNKRHGFNIHSTGSSTSCTFTGCYANNNGQIGYNLPRLFYSALSGCAADSNGLGYLLTTCSAVTLTGCGAEATVAKNGQDGTPFKIVSSEGITLSGCSVSNNATTGIWLAGTGNAHLIHGCVEQSTSGTPAAFVRVDPDVSATLISHAHVTPNVLQGTVTQIDQGAGQLNLPGYLYGASSIEAAGHLISSGNLSLLAPGSGINIAEGANARLGVATLAAGTRVVNTTAVTAGSRIFLTCQTPGGTPGWLRVSARTAGTSFTITSSSGSDTSVVAWMIVQPA